jgi:hypothetical protein
MVGERLNTQALGVALRATVYPKDYYQLREAARRTLCRERRRPRLISAFWQQASWWPRMSLYYAGVNQSIDHERNSQGSHHSADGAIDKVGDGFFMGTSQMTCKSSSGLENYPPGVH